MAKAGRGFWLLYNYYSNVAPWCCLFGAPNFPQYSLFKPNSTFGDSLKVLKEYNSNGDLTKVKGTNSSSQTTEIQFTYDTPNKKITAECYNGTTKELTVVEQFNTNGSLDINTTCHLDTSKNVTINVIPSTSYRMVFNFTININSKQLTGSLTWGDEEVPQIMLDLMDEIDDIADPEEIAALESKIMETLLGEGFISREGPKSCISENTLCAAGAIACIVIGGGITAPIAGGLWAVANAFILDQLQEEEKPA